MANINQIKNKSIGIVRKIINRLNSLNLKKYFFECAIILMNSMLRPSILYAAEMYYNLKEPELRQIERIEEGFLRKILNTTRGCPIIKLYLEVGQYPARFEIQRMRLLYLKIYFKISKLVSFICSYCKYILNSQCHHQSQREILVVKMVEKVDDKIGI